MMVPGQVTMIPRYLMIQKIHLYNTIWGIILPGLVSAFSIYLAKQFIEDVPDSLCEAAKIDGAGSLRIYWSVILPNIRPAIGSIGIFTAMQVWNDYLNPLLMLNDMDKMTLPLGLVIFEGQLTRGPAPGESYYDEVDLAPFMKRGQNNVSVLVWYYSLSKNQS